MNQEQRNALRVAVQGWRRLLQEDIEGQLSAVYGITRPEGTAAPVKGKGRKAAAQDGGDPQALLLVRDLSDVPRVQRSRRLQARREIMLTAIRDLATRREVSAGKSRPEGAAGDGWPALRVLDLEGYVRACAFTLLNRLVGIRLLEVRGHYKQAFLNGQDEPPAVRLFAAVTGKVLTDTDPYEVFTSMILQDVTRFAPGLGGASGRFDLLFPGRETVLDISRSMAALDPAIWQSDETLGWVAQYFTPEELRKKVRKESPTPRSSDELAFRNQFFTPNYVVRFLVQNTLGRSWLEMHPETALAEGWEYLVRDELQHRPLKDPRDLKVIDPACGSGHFLLYAFDVLYEIYFEVYHHDTLGEALRSEYPDQAEFARKVPELIVERNLYGVDIDLRVAQITQVALELKAASYHPQARPQTTHIVHAQQLPGDKERFQQFVLEELATYLTDEKLGELNLARTALQRYAPELPDQHDNATALQSLLEQPTFYQQHTQIRNLTRAIETAWQAHYAQPWQARHHTYQQAAQQLRANPAFAALDEDAAEMYASQLLSYAGTEEPAESNWRQNSPSIGHLQADIDAAQTRLAQILKLMKDALPEPVAIEIKVRRLNLDPTDMARATEELDTYLSELRQQVLDALQRGEKVVLE